MKYFRRRAHTCLNDNIISAAGISGRAFLNQNTLVGGIIAMANEVKLNPAGGVPKIDLTFGFAQFAKFRIFLWDANGQNPQEVMLGSNLPGSPHEFSVGVPAAQLIGRFLTWDTLIASPTGGPGQQYSMTARFIQDNKTIPNATFTRSGQLEGAAVDMDQAKFV